MHRRHIVWRTVLATAAATAVLVGLSANAANAATNTFARQARHAGLDYVQSGLLQGRVNDYLASTRGAQTAANEVRLPGGALLTVALPGESAGRRLPDSALAAANVCFVPGLCLWSQEGYRGDVIEPSTFDCSTFYMPWVGWGSWTNSQANGQQVQFQGASHNPLYTSGPAPNFWSPWNWTETYYVDPC